MTSLIIKDQACRIWQEKNDKLACEDDKFVGWLQETNATQQQVIAREMSLNKEENGLA